MFYTWLDEKDPLYFSSSAAPESIIDSNFVGYKFSIE